MSINRLHTETHMSQIVVHKGTVYLAGQVGEPGSSVAEQTRQALAEVERLLAEVGSSAEHILNSCRSPFDSVFDAVSNRDLISGFAHSGLLGD